MTDDDLKDKDAVLLLDGDIYAYRAAAATDGRTYTVLNQTYKYKKDADMASAEASGAEVRLDYIPEPQAHAYHLIKSNINKLDTEFTKAWVKSIAWKETFLSEGGSFREKEVNPGYKQNRAGIRRPYHLAGCKKFLRDKYDAIAEVGELEADDLLIIRAEEIKGAGRYTPIICSIDKDLRQYEGWHYNFQKGELKYVTGDEAHRNFYSQLLTGDSTDGIIGLKGVGPKTAEKILKPYTTSFEMYKAVLAEWIKRGKREPGEDQAPYYTRKIAEVRMTARLLYLLRKRGEHWGAPVEESNNG